MKLKFCDKFVCGSRVSVSTAQAVFDKWYSEHIENAPIVYGKFKDNVWTKRQGELDTYSAKLVCIEELKKGCKGIHTVSMDQLDQQGQALCLVCGVMLKEVITWEAVE